MVIQMNKKELTKDILKWFQIVKTLWSPWFIWKYLRVKDIIIIFLVNERDERYINIMMRLRPENLWFVLSIYISTQDLPPHIFHSHLFTGSRLSPAEHWEKCMPSFPEQRFIPVCSWGTSDKLSTSTEAVINRKNVSTRLSFPSAWIGMHYITFITVYLVEIFQYVHFMWLYFIQVLTLLVLEYNVPHKMNIIPILKISIFVLAGHIHSYTAKSFLTCLSHSYWERNACLNIKICKSKSQFKHMSNFHPCTWSCGSR